MLRWFFGVPHHEWCRPVKRPRLVLVVLATVLAQLLFFGDLVVAGVRLDIAVAVAAAVGLSLGAVTGAWLAFAIGALLDLFLSTPFGLSALAYGLAAFVVGWVADSNLSTTLVHRIAIVAGATVFATMVFAVVGTVIGQTDMLTGRLPRIVIVMTLANVVLAAPVLWAVSSLFRPVLSRSRLM